MNFEPIKKFFSLFLTALGLLIVIIVVYVVFLTAHYARQKQGIKSDYANEYISPSPTVIPNK